MKYFIMFFVFSLCFLIGANIAGLYPNIWVVLVAGLILTLGYMNVDQSHGRKSK